jgi:hypothetical protein
LRFFSFLQPGVRGCRRSTSRRCARRFCLSSSANPEVLIPADNEEVDSLEYFSEFRKLPYSLSEVKLGEDIVGYRSDLETGARAANHTRLFELKNGRLEQVFELKGPYLFIHEEDVERVSGRCRLSYCEGWPEYLERHFYEYRDGKYVKLPLPEFVGEDK